MTTRTKADDTLSISFTVVASETDISKRFGVVDGRPKKLSSDAVLFKGRAKRQSLTGSATEIASGFAKVLAGLGTKDVLICAPPPPGRDEWALVTEDRRLNTPDSISRTKACFPAVSGPGLIGLDFDTKEYPVHIREQFHSRKMGISSALERAFPELAHAASVTRPSMSCGVQVKETGRQTPANAGQHRYFFALDAANVREFAERLRDRLMLDGWIFGFVSKAGDILLRTLFDFAASSDTSRLWYEGQALISDDLEFVAGARDPEIKAGGFLNIAELPPLTNEENANLKALQEQVRLSKKEEADRVREMHRKEIAQDRPALQGDTISTREYAKALDARELQGDFPIRLDDGTTTTPREILKNRNAFHGKTGPDPLEPDYGGGRNKMIIYADGPGPVRIESQAHGGQRFLVVPCVEDYFEVIVDEDIADPFGYGDTSSVLEVPREAVPSILYDWAVDVSERIGTPTAYAVAAGLATISGAIGSKVRVQPKEHDTSWTEPAFLWIVIVEEPGGKKSPILRQATGPLMKVDATRARAGEKSWAEWSQRQKSRKRNEASSFDPEPKTKRNVVDGFTMEALAGVLADNPGGVLVVQDELTALIGSFDAYKGGKGSDRAQMLRLYDGAQASVDRVGRRHIHVECWGAAVVGGIQPRKVAEMAKSLEADGLLQRFIPVYGDGAMRAGVDRAPDAKAMSAYTGIVETLGRLDPVIGDTVRLSPSAQTIWRPLAGRIEALRSLAGMSDAWRGHLGKWPGTSARILLICHVLDQWSVGPGLMGSTPVSGETAKRAVRLVEWMIGNSLRFYQECIGAGEAGDDAKWLAGHFLAHATKGIVSRRDIGDMKRDLRASHEKIVGAMAFLEQFGWVTPTADTRDRDRLGPKRWTICPDIHDGRFASRTEKERKRRDAMLANIKLAGNERARLFRGDVENGQ